MKAKFHLDSSRSQQIADQLYKIVANTYALYFLTLHAHWNIEDPGFLALHEMLEEQYNQLAQTGDDLAERIRIMGYKVKGSIQALAAASDLKEHHPEASAQQLLEHLAEGHERAFLALRELSDLGEEAKDFGLVDLLGSLTRAHEKTAWILRSHLK